MMNRFIINIAQIDEGLKNDLCNQLDGNNDGCGTGGETEIARVWDEIINVLIYVIGAVSVLMIVIGALRYVISAGDQQAVAGAKNTIIYAVVGVIIALFARAIMFFVFDSVF